MRRTYISPEFTYKGVPGTLNMKEQSSFFGSKMLEIDDELVIKRDNISYYESEEGDQININDERSLNQIFYDAVADKKSNHNISIDQNSNLNGSNRWIVNIQLRKILRNYLFATLKKWRTFEGVRNNMTINNNVNSAISAYIDNNIIGRYKFSKIELFLKSVDILSVGGLKYGNKFDETIESESNVYKKFQTNIDPNDIDVVLSFYQENDSSDNTFNYYFNIYFEKL